VLTVNFGLYFGQKKFGAKPTCKLLKLTTGPCPQRNCFLVPRAPLLSQFQPPGSNIFLMVVLEFNRQKYVFIYKKF